MGFSAVVKGNHSDMVLLDTPPHVDAVTDASKTALAQVPERTAAQPHNTPASLSPALDNMKVVTELMAGLRILLLNTKADINCPKSLLKFITFASSCALCSQKTQKSV
jgi:hypothetical protein